MDDVDSIRKVLSGHTITLDRLQDYAGIFDHADTFANQCRENKTVKHVVLCLDADPDANRYATWDRVAEGIGNLQALHSIIIEDVEETPLAPDWEILALILRRLRQRIRVRMLAFKRDTGFAEAIHGTVMIARNTFSFDSLDILFSALPTLLGLQGDAIFEDVHFTKSLCQALAKTLKERSEITGLYFFPNCSFPEGGLAVIASALTTNTTLENLKFDDGTDEVFYEVLAETLMTNSTLQSLDCPAPGSCSWLVPLFVALQVNTGLKNVCIDGVHLIDENLSTAMMLGLSNNSTLETFKLSRIKSGENDICLWREALSFLPANKALKTLHMQFDEDVTESRVATILKEAAAAVRENASLETLTMSTTARMKQNAMCKAYILFVTAIQPNTTLKSLRLHSWLHNWHSSLEGDERREFVSVLKRNYGLEEIPNFPPGAGDIRSILDLNRAERRYLVLDGSSISKGVAVLSGVKDDINSVFLHLLENPRLCDRNAVEMTRSSIANVDSVGSTSPGSCHSGDKRELQAPSHPGKETRRRLE
jgi:hypothetical protein